MNELWQTIQAGVLDFPGDWRLWWSGQSWRHRLLPIALAVAGCAPFFVLNGLRSDHILAFAFMLALHYAGPRLQPVFELLFPLFLTAVIYDSQRFYADILRGPVHVQEPYFFDRHFFGITLADGTIATPNEWWQLHTCAPLDFLTGLAYIIFVPMFVLTVVYFRFWLGRQGASRLRAAEIQAQSGQIMWAFFWVNMLGYATYYLYAASPPWYVALYGLTAPVNLQEPANLAGCVRFDELVGIPFFREWYGRSTDVHGAVPSLHVAYPLQTVYYAYKFGAARTISTAFYLLMCFSAVYLNHHYILDLVWGSAYAIIVCLAVDFVWKRRPMRTTVTS